MITRSSFVLCLIAAFLLSSGTPARAQGATSSITGSVIDSAGGAIPGATVVVKNPSGVSFEAVSNGEGLFNVPGVPPGVYAISVSLSGFKTAVMNDVRVLPGTPATVKATLEVGQISETVNVAASSELVNSQTATISSTLNADQLLRMPTPTRNALNAVTFLPGINTATTNRESRINGLPESFVSITLDGVSNNDNFLRSSDSFFASVTPRQDAVEAVNVTTAVQPVTTGGSGAVSINFTTRSGTNELRGSGYEYWRNPALNTNYWFNERNGLPKNEVKLNQFGFRVGGPVVLPGAYDGHNKTFFFTNYEQVRFPNEFSRNRTILHPRALEGWFRYTVSGQTREVNVLDLARQASTPQNPQIFATDPTVMSLLAKIASATGSAGAVTATSDPLLNNFAWQSPGRLFEHQPTFRIDHNLSNSHRLSGSYQVIRTYRDPDYLNNADARFPAAPNYRYYSSTRPLSSFSLRSTLSGNKVNEVRVGMTAFHGSSAFGLPTDPSLDVGSFADQGGYAIDFDGNIGLTNWFTTNGPSWRAAPTYSVDETLTWQRGRHSLNFGGGFLRATAWENEQQVVPGINLGMSTNFDPAQSLFNSTNFPNASTAQLSDARDLYALLTGRVIAVTGQAALDAGTNQYTAFGPVRREGRVDTYSAFAQDSWRMSPNVTLTGGLRWDVQMPFSAGNSTMTTVGMADVCGTSGLGDGGTYSRCNFLSPGAGGGIVPSYGQLTKGTLGYKTDWNNLAPSVGVAWRPNQQGGFWRTLLGDPELATVRAGYSVAYERQGMAVWTDTYGGNPGSTISLTRNENNNNLVLPGESWPVLLSQTNRLYNQGFNENPSFPIAVRANRADSLNGFAPDVKIGSAHTWTVSLQRSISRDTAIEARYVGTYGMNQWSTLDYNCSASNNANQCTALRGEVLAGNGFLDEFRRAMRNLQANNASGIPSRSGSFAYFGPGTGTSPLPIYLAYLNGSRDAGNPAAYTGGTNTWANSTIAQRLSPANPNPNTAAGTDLEGNATRRGNALAAGLPANFFMLNPDVGEVNVTDSGAFSDYHALQLELRRRLSAGLAANVNYQYAIERGSAFDGFSFGRHLNDQANVRHAIKLQADWTVPVGRGHRYGGNMHPVLDAIAGGWSVNGVGRFQARTINLGNVRLVGMTKDELQAMYKFDIRVDPATGLNTVYMLPDDVILNTRRAFSVSNTTVSGYSESLGVPEGRYLAPANGGDCLQVRAGDCAPRTLLVRAPWFSRVDLGVTKQFPIHRRLNFELRIDVLNLFDNVNFDPAGATGTNSAAGTGATIFQTGTAYTDPSNTYDPGGRLGQIMFRINW